MSEENVELAGDAFSRWNAGSVRLRMIHPDAEILGRGLMEGRRSRGREGVRRWFLRGRRAVRRVDLTMEEWRDAGDCVVALGQAHMHGRESGSHSTNRLAGCRDLRRPGFPLGDLLEDPNEALEAAGAVGVGPDSSHRSADVGDLATFGTSVLPTLACRSMFGVERSCELGLAY